MIYSIGICLNDAITDKISDDLYWRNNFTLTANAVNNAPVFVAAFGRS